MEKKMHAIWFLVICAIGFSVTSIMVTTNLISGFDSVISTFIQSNPSKILTRISKVLALIGGPKIEVIIAVALTVPVVLFYRKSQIAKVRVAVSSLVLFATVNVVTYFSNSALKHLFQRHRPMSDMGGYSFPSNHAMMAFAFYITAAYLIWDHMSSRIGRIILLVTCSTMPIVIGISRIYLHKHYPSDIIAGFFVSGFILAIIIFLYERKGRKCM